MIRVIKTLLPALLMVACTCKVPEKGALILGQVSALDPGDKIIAVLFQFDGKAGKRIQTDTLKNGHFTFRLDSLGEADHYMISLFRSGKGYSDVINYGPELYLDTGTVVRHTDPEFVSEKLCKACGIVAALFVLIIMLIIDFKKGNLSFSKEKNIPVTGIPVYDIPQI